jgi:hypothetical protein
VTAKGSPFLSLVYGLGAFLIIFPEPITTLPGSLLVAWAMHQTLRRRRGAYGACRCDYHRYGPCLFSGFPYLEVWDSLPPKRKIVVGPTAALPRPGIFPLPPRGAKAKWEPSPIRPKAALL